MWRNDGTQMGLVAGEKEWLARSGSSQRDAQPPLSEQQVDSCVRWTRHMFTMGRQLADGRTVSGKEKSPRSSSTRPSMQQRPSWSKVSTRGA
eukprot:5269605-Amphidinium_carterae.1